MNAIVSLSLVACLAGMVFGNHHQQCMSESKASEDAIKGAYKQMKSGEKIDLSGNVDSYFYCIFKLLEIVDANGNVNEDTLDKINTKLGMTDVEKQQCAKCAMAIPPGRTEQQIVSDLFDCGYESNAMARYSEKYGKKE